MVNSLHEDVPPSVCYITQQAPFGVSETFISTEIEGLLDHGARVIVTPIRPMRQMPHGGSDRYRAACRAVPMLGGATLIALLITLVQHPLRLLRALTFIVLRSFPRPLNLLKNLMIVPKACFIARVCHEESIGHVHAHWLTTSATAALMVQFLRPPCGFSLTTHRGDIDLRNMIPSKVAYASFVRCGDEVAAREVRSLVPSRLHEKIVVRHMGYPIPSEPAPLDPDRIALRIIVPANLVEKKGHAVLLTALRGLPLPEGTTVSFAGVGPLKAQIQRQIEDMDLEQTVRLTGLCPHDQLMEIYRKGDVDIVVLPSIITRDGQKEGIPNTLIEAMAWGIPSIGTDTGGTNELLDDRRGWLLQPGDVEALTRAIAEAVQDAPERLRRAARGREWVEKEFNLAHNAEWLLRRFSGDWQRT